jgi:2-iminobutanoate/2-iminopropanoate deaminase
LKEIIKTDKSPSPHSPVYSQATKIQMPKALIYVTGQGWSARFDGDSGRGDPAVQADSALSHIKAILQEAGATMNDVVKMTVYLRYVEDYDKIAVVRKKYFGDTPPASTAVEVNKFVNHEMLVEIDCIAALN